MFLFRLCGGHVVNIMVHSNQLWFVQWHSAASCACLSEEQQLVGEDNVPTVHYVASEQTAACGWCCVSMNELSGAARSAVVAHCVDGTDNSLYYEESRKRMMRVLVSAVAGGVAKRTTSCARCFIRRRTHVVVENSPQDAFMRGPAGR